MGRRLSPASCPLTSAQQGTQLPLPQLILSNSYSKQVQFNQKKILLCMGRLQTVSQKVSLPPHPHKVSLCNSPGYPGTYSVEQASLKLTEKSAYICLLGV